jgi:glycosyltransferase involved in cell wall biosynthesis
MKILLAHNFYQQPGGEDQVFADYGWLLESHGHEVVRFSVHNDALKQTGALKLAAQTVWNSAMHGQMRDMVRREKPAVVHFQNTFPLISPAAYYAARAEGAAVVQELPNYRLLCPNAQLLRDGKVCEACLGKTVPWPGVLHGCYRESRATTAVVVTMLSVHRLMGTWTAAVDAYIALTQFSRNKMIEGGLPAGKIHVKGNFINPDPTIGAGGGGYALFVGRLSPEKGVETLLSAWELLEKQGGAVVPLKILGDGPLAPAVKSAAERLPSVQWLGRRPLPEVLDTMGGASVLIFPSQWYEGQPKTILESLAKGTPVLASRLGAMQEMLDGGKTGVLFNPGDPADLADNVRSLMADPQRLADMRPHARAEYERLYAPERNYGQLIEIYDRAIAEQRSRAAG